MDQWIIAQHSFSFAFIFVSEFIAVLSRERGRFGMKDRKMKKKLALPSKQQRIEEKLFTDLGFSLTQKLIYQKPRNFNLLFS